MLRTISLSFLVFILFTAIGCKNSNNPLSAQSNLHIWPLAMGNSWTLRSEVYDSNGVLLDSSAFSFWVKKDTIINSTNCYMLFEMAIPLATYNMNKSDGLWSLYMSTSYQSSYLIYKYPATVGDQYSAPATIDGVTATVNYKLISTNASVSVPAGNFNCYQYQYTDSSGGINNIYLCPGVGPIKISHTLITSTSRIYMDLNAELKSYILK
jgi:hypothetical protein